MTLRHMKIFVTVCECNSITAAAKKLYLAQPAVSLAISELEKFYAVHLFDRISRRLYITQVGERFLSYALHITSLFDEMESEIKNWDSIGMVKIGSSITIGTYLMPYYVKQFSNENSEVDVSVVIDNSKNIENKLLANELDFGMIEGVAYSDMIVSEEFANDELVLVCAPSYSFADVKEVSLEQLKSERFLLRERGSGTREMVDSILTSHGLSIMPAWESTSTRALINAVINGIGISILPFQLVQQELAEKKLVMVNIGDVSFVRKFSFIYHKNKYLTAAAKRFMEIVKAGESKKR